MATPSLDNADYYIVNFRLGIATLSLGNWQRVQRGAEVKVRQSLIGRGWRNNTVKHVLPNSIKVKA